jgi:hypothetical protein
MAGKQGRALRSLNVIASVSEAIHSAASGWMDCFVAIAPRNDEETAL